MAEPVLVVRVAANITELRKNLLEGTSIIETTKSAMTSMSNAFDGSKIIAQSGAVMAQIQSIGGVTKLTADEQDRANRILEAGLAKYQALGREAPPGMQALAESTRNAASAQSDLLDSIGRSGGRMEGLTDATKAADGQTQSITSSYRQFDGVLQSMGIRVGPQIKALEDIAGASGKSATQIGLLGTAGLALGAGYGGWKIGRMIAEFFDLDKSVEKVWRQLLYYGDVAVETAGAKQDTINRAIAAGAKEGIKYSEAVQFMIDAAKRSADANIDWAMRLSNAQKELRGLSDSTKTQIEVATAAGASTEQLTNKYGLSALALKILADRKNVATGASKAHTEAVNTERAAIEAAAAATAKRAVENEKQLDLMMRDARLAADRAVFDAQEKVTTDAKAEAARGWMQAVGESVKVTNAQREAEQSLQTVQTDGLTIIGQTTAELQNAGTAARDTGAAGINAFAGIAQQVQITGDGLKEYINLMRYTAQANEILGRNGLYTSQGQREAIAALPSPRAKGGPVSAGSPYMVGERGPEMFVPERSGTIVPNGAGGGITIAPVLNFNAPVIGSAMEFEQTVAGAILNLAKSGAIPMPAGG